MPSSFALVAGSLESRPELGIAHDPAAGGVVVFAGRVRANNDGRGVVALEYTAYTALALKQGRRVLDDARSQFGLLQAHAVHRLGRLLPGEMAIWVRVAAPHREPAFAACARIVTEIKQTVPIWKKELYVDGATQWIVCA